MLSETLNSLLLILYRGVFLKHVGIKSYKYFSVKLITIIFIISLHQKQAYTQITSEKKWTEKDTSWTIDVGVILHDLEYLSRISNDTKHRAASQRQLSL